jgi:hypothetical protein
MIIDKREPQPGDVITVWYSCGAASTIALKLTLEKYGDYCTVRAVNNPIAEEDIDNQRFLLDVADWLGVRIEKAINPAFPSCSAVEVWDKAKAMSFPHGAPCTGKLKKEARQIWEANNPTDWIVLGFTAEEKHRYERFVTFERNDLLPVLIDANVSKADCFRMIQEAGLRLPRGYLRGDPNGNCQGCVKATSPTYWNHVRKNYPDVFASRAEQSRRLGVRLARHKGKRVFLDELPPDAKGRPMKNMDFECGIFCEEK